MSQVQKRKVREKQSREKWNQTNLLRARKRRISRRARKAKAQLELGNLKGVITNLRYIKEQGDPEETGALLDVITVFAKKGAQRVRVDKVR